MIPADRIVFHNDGTAWVVCHDNEHNDAAFRWDLLDRPCVTCDGDCEDGPNFYTPIAWRCPDCIDGRHTFQVAVQRRSTCSGHSYYDHSPCWDCEQDAEAEPIMMRVSVVPDMILPIYGYDQSSGPWGGPHIVRTGGATRLWTTEDIYHHVILPPAAALGMWAIHLQTERTNS